MKATDVSHPADRISSSGPSHAEIELTRGYVALVDQEDFDLVNRYKWGALTPPDTDRVYARGWAGKRSILMHRLIMGAAKGEEVDHHNHNGLDNRRSNLRLCSSTQNHGNTRIRRSNTSGFKGVFFDARWNRWRALIQFEGKLIYLGRFDSREHAALTYNAAARRYFGEFARPNWFPIRRRSVS